MRLLGDSLDAWMELQRMWVYLEPIFSAPDIQRQLPDEAQQFNSIDRSFRAQVLAIRERRNVMQTFASSSLLQACKQKNEVLEHILVRLHSRTNSVLWLLAKMYQRPRALMTSCSCGGRKQLAIPSPITL